MGYKISPSNSGAVFFVPSQIVDEHIKLASGQQLKVLLWAFRHSADGIDLNAMSRDLNFSPADIKDYLQYWIETGILLSDDEPALIKPQQAVLQESRIASEVKDKANRLPDIVPVRPSAEEIAVRAEESPDIKFLLCETQVKLGRTIGYDGQCSLLMLHDTYGLPVEVILMIIEYAVSVGKSSFQYISAVGKDWGEREIDTIEKADEQIKILRSVNSLWTTFSAMAGLSNPKPTKAQSAMLVVWSNDWGFDAEMIYLAYEQMYDHCGKLSFPYMNKILETWHNAKIGTPDQVEKYEQERKLSSKPTKEKAHSAKSSSSYDLDEFEKNAKHKPLVYNKKKNSEDK